MARLRGPARRCRGFAAAFGLGVGVSACAAPPAESNAESVPLTVTPIAIQGMRLEGTGADAQHASIGIPRTGLEPTSLPLKGVPFQDPVTGTTITRLTDIGDLVDWGERFPPKIPPYNMQRTATVQTHRRVNRDGVRNGYSKYPTLSKDNRYAVGFIFGRIGVWDLATSGTPLVRILARDPANHLIEGNEPRWDKRPGHTHDVIWHAPGGKGMFASLLDVPYSGPHASFADATRLFENTHRQIVPALSDTVGTMTVRQSDSGSEMDTDWSGRWWPTMLSLYNSAAKRVEAQVIGVTDLNSGEMLPGRIVLRAGDNYPNALDVSPDGKWLALLCHLDYGSGGSGARMAQELRFYRIADLARGDTSHPVFLDSAITERFRSVGHNGWAYDLDGNSVFIYQDNRDDFIKFADLNATRTVTDAEGTRTESTSTNVFYYGDWGWKTGFHFGSIQNPAIRGWMLIGTSGDGGESGWWSKGQMLMVQLKPREQKPKVWRIGSMQLKGAGYNAEGYCNLSLDGESICFASNWNGHSELELYRADLPAVWWERLPH